MNNSDSVSIVNGWVFFGRSEAVPLDAISAIYIQSFGVDIPELRVERHGCPDADLTVFVGSERECRSRIGGFQAQVALMEARYE